MASSPGAAPCYPESAPRVFWHFQSLQRPTPYTGSFFAVSKVFPHNAYAASAACFLSDLSGWWARPTAERRSTQAVDQAQRHKKHSCPGICLPHLLLHWLLAASSVAKRLVDPVLLFAGTADFWESLGRPALGRGCQSLKSSLKTSQGHLPGPDCGVCFRALADRRYGPRHGTVLLLVPRADRLWLVSQEKASTSFRTSLKDASSVDCTALFG